jgi:hypothetical protein
MTALYTTFPVVEDSNIIQEIPGRKLKEHIRQLSIPIEPEPNSKINGFDVEFQVLFIDHFFILFHLAFCFSMFDFFFFLIFMSLFFIFMFDISFIF